jgi:aspartyl-tRNA(Asn)/glutamyl-tRNA(Gln) amidotransferase subunit A
MRETDDRIIAAGAVGLGKMFAAGTASPVQALEAFWARIQRLNPALNALADLDEAGAQADAAASAARWREGAPRSLVDGAPIVVKANLAVRGLAWTAALTPFKDRIAPEDSAAVARLRAAGAIILGIANQHEAALGATTTSPLYGPCRNPAKLSYTPGGSSGGSAAAVAAGLAAGALGTDSMGSVRLPSAYCGVFGFKPSFGAISRVGLETLSWTLDHVGVHARTAADLTALAATLIGFDARDPFSMRHRVGAPASPPRLKGARLGVVDTAGVQIAGDVQAAFEGALERLRRAGAVLRPVRLEGYQFDLFRRAGLLVCEAEGAAGLGAVRHDAGLSKELRALLDYGARAPAERLAEALRRLAQTRLIARAALQGVAALVLPTAPQTAFPHGQAAPSNQADLTAFANFAGLPAVSIPIGETPAGLPCGAQLIAPYGADQRLLGLTQTVAASLSGLKELLHADP